MKLQKKELCKYLVGDFWLSVILFLAGKWNSLVALVSFTCQEEVQRSWYL